MSLKLYHVFPHLRVDLEAARHEIAQLHRVPVVIPVFLLLLKIATKAATIGTGIAVGHCVTTRINAVVLVVLTATTCAE
eukprot:CAMPEP_0179009322 /NCGR_PEP_ID=MMETSP0795-20121207/16210_1 /TAXON_ID=88552 /ORGANISM="Amoebophrya sp., Strain Ameob2" /LENGTH=78 /DNA_ID=CAMNT_0020704511 /DNA_START=238 /DNA_END=474 /DNA_ORIENTATION=+